MYNPFLDKSDPSEQTDHQLIGTSLNGDRSALEEIIRRHQGWIYNICLRMVGNPEDSADLTQEILIKVITALGTFEQKSNFRTWLYRIVKNNAINWEIKKAKIPVSTFQQFGDALDRTADSEISDNEYYAADKDLLVSETKHRCMTGMLLCLDKQQRLVFILGELLEVSDTIGSEIMEITKPNFRTMLSRAKKQLYNFMQEKCGLINKNNPCRCAKKTKAFIQAGIVDPDNLQFVPSHLQDIEKVAGVRHDQMEGFLENEYRNLYQKHPFLSGPDFVDGLRQMLSSDRSQHIFQINYR